MIVDFLFVYCRSPLSLLNHFSAHSAFRPSACSLILTYIHVLHPQLTSQDHTPEVIRRALEKHNMEDFSCQEFSLCQTLKCGKGRVSTDNLHTVIDLNNRKKTSFSKTFPIYSAFIFFPFFCVHQSSRSRTKPTYFTLCVPPPTMTLCFVSDGEATGDVLAPLPAL